MNNGRVTAFAQGHASEVISAFHSISSILLSGLGPWRIEYVEGTIDSDSPLDSNMTWELISRVKPR
jgi:hypothetical protein